MPKTFRRSVRQALPLAIRILIGLVLLLGAVGLLYILRATKAQPGLSEEARLPPLVRTVEVQRVVTARPWTGYGTVRAMGSARVAVQVAGRVIERPETVEAGLPVAPGDLLLRIDPADSEQRVASLEGVVAALEAESDQLDVEADSLDEQLTLVLEESEIALREYERARAVYEDRGAGSRAEVDQKLAALRRAEREAAALDQRSRSVPARGAALDANLSSQMAELALARQDLDRTLVRAPIGGVLQDVMLDEGDYAQVGSEAARIVDLRLLELPLALPATAAGDITIGDAVEVSLESGSDARWQGRIARLAPEADARTRSILVFVEVVQDPDSNEQGTDIGTHDLLLRPGMFVVGRVLPSRPTAHLLVPRRAVAQGGVLVADMGSPARARRVGVEALFAFEGSFEGAPEGETQWLAVRADLSEGGLVLVSNLDDLRDGSPIRVDEWRETP